MPTKRKTSLQCRALPHTCQPAKPSATNGISVTSPVMIRSRVSLATGWISDGRGPGSAIRWNGSYASQMPFASTAPLRREIEERIPRRPFTVEFWDGTRLSASDGSGPTFYVRSPRAAAHVLRAPGQLGLGRAYVSGEIEVDDIDSVIELLDSWQPPPLER